MLHRRDEDVDYAIDIEAVRRVICRVTILRGSCRMRAQRWFARRDAPRRAQRVMLSLRHMPRGACCLRDMQDHDVRYISDVMAFSSPC